jgi:hypothetical protein
MPDYTNDDFTKAIDTVLKTLRELKKKDEPLTPERCGKLADFLEKLFKKSDDYLAMKTLGIEIPDVKQVPGQFDLIKNDTEWNLWEFKKVTDHNGAFMFPIPLFNDQKPSIMAVNDGYYTKIKDWDKERIKVKEYKGKQYYWFNLYPKQIDQNNNMLVDYLRKNNFLYVNNNK